MRHEFVILPNSLLSLNAGYQHNSMRLLRSRKCNCIFHIQGPSEWGRGKYMGVGLECTFAGSETNLPRLKGQNHFSTKIFFFDFVFGHFSSKIGGFPSLGKSQLGKGTRFSLAKTKTNRAKLEIGVRFIRPKNTKTGSLRV